VTIKDDGITDNRAAFQETTDAAHAQVERIPIEAARAIDYAMISMVYVRDKVEAEAQAKLAEEQKEHREKVREIEKRYGITMYDENWNRCGDTLDPLTGIVTKDGFTKKQAAGGGK
jgi:hypothetical protein